MKKEFLSLYSSYFLLISSKTFKLLKDKYFFYCILSDCYYSFLYNNKKCDLYSKEKLFIELFIVISSSNSSSSNSSCNLKNEKYKKENNSTTTTTTVKTNNHSHSNNNHHNNHDNNDNNNERNIPPGLFMKLDNELYLINHSLIEKLLFPKQLIKYENQEEKLDDKSFIIIKWPTISLKIFVSDKFSQDIAYRKLSSAIISMNRILKPIIPQYQEIETQIKEESLIYQDNQFKEYQMNKTISSNIFDDSLDSSSVTFGRSSQDLSFLTPPIPSQQQQQQQKEEKKEIEKEQKQQQELSSLSDLSQLQQLDFSNTIITELLQNQNYLYASYRIENSLNNWMNTCSIASYLLQPIVSIPTLYELCSSSNLSTNNKSENLLNSTKSIRKRSQSIDNNTFESSSKRFRSENEMCLLNLSYDINVHQNFPSQVLSTPLSSDLNNSSNSFPNGQTSQPPESQLSHPYLLILCNSLNQSILKYDESSLIEDTLHKTLSSIESTIFDSISQIYPNSFTPSSLSTNSTINISTTPSIPIFPSTETIEKYCDELEEIFSNSYSSVIDQITTFRTLPRNDFREFISSNNNNNSNNNDNINNNVNIDDNV